MHGLVAGAILGSSLVGAKRAFGCILGEPFERKIMLHPLNGSMKALEQSVPGRDLINRGFEKVRRTALETLG